MARKVVVVSVSPVGPVADIEIAVINAVLEKIGSQFKVKDISLELTRQTIILED